MKYFFTGLLLLLSSQIFAQNASDSIHLNQVAFCQTGPKEAIVITAATAGHFQRQNLGPIQMKVCGLQISAL